MSLSTLYGFGGGGVGQKFKPLRNKSVSEWVSSNVDKYVHIYIYIYQKLDHWIMQFKTFYWLSHYGI